MIRFWKESDGRSLEDFVNEIDNKVSIERVNGTNIEKVISVVVTKFKEVETDLVVTGVDSNYTVKATSNYYVAIEAIIISTP